VKGASTRRAGSDSSKSPPPGLEMTVFLGYSHIAERKRERERGSGRRGRKIKQKLSDQF
jgi:hypothetical protein